ncbi:MAG: CBS domain-containing protein [Myxococcota bacterium]
MELQELMTPDPERVRVDYLLAEAGRRMVQLGIRHLPVVDDEGRLVGLLSDFDVFRRGAFLDGAYADGDNGWIAYEKADDDATCGDAMVAAEVTLNPELAAEAALQALHRSEQDALVVVDGRFHPIGVLSEHDALAVALEQVDPTRSASAIASSPVESLEASELAIVAFGRLKDHDIRHLVVTEGGDLFGVVSLRDLVADDVPRRPGLLLRDVLRSTSPVRAEPDTPLVDVIATMKRHKHGCMPIVDASNRPVGIITRRDVIGLILVPG